MSKSNRLLSVSIITLVSGFGVSVCEAASSGYFFNVEGAWVMPTQSTQVYTVTTPDLPQPPVIDDYVSGERAKVAAVGVGFGYQLARPNARWLPNYRISVLYNYFVNSTVKGYIEKYQTDKDYDFAYKINSQVLWLNGQADLMTYKAFTPFVEVGVGAALNASHGYNETPLDDAPPRVSADFGNNTVTQLAYMAGAGINYAWQIKQHSVNIGFGYRYVDLGHAETKASATYDTVTQRLTKSIKASELLLSIRTDL